MSNRIGLLPTLLNWFQRRPMDREPASPIKGHRHQIQLKAEQPIVKTCLCFGMVLVVRHVVENGADRSRHTATIVANYSVHHGRSALDRSAPNADSAASLTAVPAVSIGSPSQIVELNHAPVVTQPRQASRSRTGLFLFMTFAACSFSDERGSPDSDPAGIQQATLDKFDSDAYSPR